MQEVTVGTRALIATIQANRERHSSAFGEATIGYQNAVKDLLEKWDECLNHHRCNKKSPLFGRPPDSDAFFSEAVREIGELRAPKHHLDEYDRALAMLQMSVNAEVTLQEHEFQQLVMDEWGWKREFQAITSSYGVR
jgi:hypothetical protein